VHYYGKAYEGLHSHSVAVACMGRMEIKQQLCHGAVLLLAMYWDDPTIGG